MTDEHILLAHPIQVNVVEELPDVEVGRPDAHCLDASAELSYGYSSIAVVIVEESQQLQLANVMGCCDFAAPAIE